MPEVIFGGPDGRLEGRYQEGKGDNPPVALILHSDPQFGSNMNHKVCYYLYHSFKRRGFSVLRFNFRGVGRSQGTFDDGIGELSDAAAALDWIQSHNRDASSCWIAGYSFGAWIGMQLLMRRPEIQGFLSVSHQPIYMTSVSLLPARHRVRSFREQQIPLCLKLLCKSWLKNYRRKKVSKFNMIKLKGPITFM